MINEVAATNRLDELQQEGKIESWEIHNNLNPNSEIFFEITLPDFDYTFKLSSDEMYEFLSSEFDQWGNDKKQWQ